MGWLFRASRVGHPRGRPPYLSHPTGIWLRGIRQHSAGQWKRGCPLVRAALPGSPSPQLTASVWTRAQMGWQPPRRPGQNGRLWSGCSVTQPELLALPSLVQMTWQGQRPPQRPRLCAQPDGGRSGAYRSLSQSSGHPYHSQGACKDWAGQLVARGGRRPPATTLHLCDTAVLLGHHGQLRAANPKARAESRQPQPH